MTVLAIHTEDFLKVVGGAATQERGNYRAIIEGLETGSPTPKLIGLTGRARSGKDTVAGMLQSAFQFKTLAFAAPLKEGLKTMLGLTDEHVHGALKETLIEDFSKSPRQMLQTLGTEWGRLLVHDNIWLTVARRKVDEWRDCGFNVAITDVRFENEAEMIRKMGGQVWHVVRDSAPQVNAHASEGGVKFNADTDFTIYNNSTLDDLFDIVCDTFEGSSHG